MVIENQRRWDGSLGSGEAGLKEVWFKCRRNVERVAEEWTLAGILFRMMLEQMYGMCGLMCCVMARCVRRLVSCQHSDLWRTYQAIARDNMMSNVMWPCIMTWLWYWTHVSNSTFNSQHPLHFQADDPWQFVVKLLKQYDLVSAKGQCCCGQGSASRWQYIHWRVLN